MDISDWLLTTVNFLLPVLTVGGILYRYKYTRRVGVLIMIPSLLYMSVYYGVFIFSTHFLDDFPVYTLQIPFRIGVTLVLLSLLIYVVSDTISLRILKKKLHEDVKEKT